MGSYLDSTWADLFALTRQRRAEARAARLAALPPTVRISALFDLPSDAKPRRRKRQAMRWLADQWDRGVQACGYCATDLTLLKDRLNSATVDHREPWLGGRGGADDPSNWLVACLACNRAKGCMTEAAFRRLICVAA